MGHKGTIVIWITAALVGLAILCAGLEEPAEVKIEAPPVLSLRVPAAGGQEEVQLWDDGSGTCYGFLPGYAQVEQAVFQVLSGYRVETEQGRIESGTSCGGFSLNVPYCLKITGKGVDQEKTLVLLSTGQQPVLYVDVASGNMDYIHMDKENAQRGKLRVYEEDGNLHYSGLLESIKGRGNATWEWEKKPYSLTLMGEEDLLGMGKAKNWVLLSNVYDDSHVRNKLVYDTAARMGLAYSPESQWVSLYLNGEYAGLYLLSEKNEIHPQRVDIGKTDGGLISIEKQDRLWQYGDDQFLTDGGIPIRIRSTSDGEGLKQKINTLERAILAEDGVDPLSGKHWQELLDLDSWARKYLIEEIFGNLDAGSISQFFYWEAGEDGGRIHAGPVWDYDVSMGNPQNWQLRDSNTLFAGRPHLWNPEDTPWFAALYEKTEFRETVMALYSQTFRPMLQRLLEGELEAYGERISDGAAANRIRWGTGAQQESLEQVKTWLQDRMAFLDSLWVEREDYHLVSVYIQWHVMACYAIPPGACVPFREVPQGWDTIEYVGWYDYATEEPFDFTKPIFEDTLIYLKEVDTAERTATGGVLSGKIAWIPVVALLTLMACVVTAEVLRGRRK